MASRVARTRAALASESARRRRIRRSAGSAMARVAFDGGEQRGTGLTGEATELDRERGVESGATCADGGDRDLDVLAIRGVEPGQHLLVGEDELAHHFDLFCRGDGIGSG